MILWDWRVEAPEAERMEVGVMAREKMSVGWARSRVCVVRYCFDMVGVCIGFVW